MKSYFFIPAGKMEKIQTILDSGIDLAIIDFEDSLIENERERYFLKLLKMEQINSFTYRVPLRNDFKEELNFEFFWGFLNAGVKKFLIPKLINLKEFNDLFTYIKNYNGVELILLVEHPRFLLDLKDVLDEVEEKNIVTGLGLGSHDLATEMDFHYSKGNLDFPRRILNFSAKAYNIEVIDMASMNITNKQRFDEEVNEGLVQGFDAKFIVHPKQLEWLKSNNKYVQKKLRDSQRIVDHLPRFQKNKEISPFVLDGRIIEKPHVEKALAILKQYGHEK